MLKDELQALGEYLLETSDPNILTEEEEQNVQECGNATDTFWAGVSHGEAIAQSAIGNKILTIVDEHGD